MTRSIDVTDLMDVPSGDEVGRNPANDGHPLTEIDECPSCGSLLVGTVEVHDGDGTRLRAQCGACPWRRYAGEGQ